MALESNKTECERIALELQLVYEGPSWLGPSVKHLLSNVGEGQAKRKPITEAHSIQELVLHMAAWLRIARERLSATELRDASDDENWPAATMPWSDALSSLDVECSKLQKAIRVFPDDRLDEPAPAAEPQTFYVLLHGVIQHTAYHAGQIAMLKK
jgi:uncharacterized damage-inducible protein DinB